MPAHRFRLRTYLDGAAGALSIAFHLGSPWLRSWRSRWGASAEELQRALPGDELVPRPRWSYTHAITIHAPVEKVWPWVVQIGYQRGGWYSYDLLEAVVKSADFVDGRSAERMIPELQDLAVDDRIYITREIGFRVAEIIPQKALVLQGRGSLPDNVYFELSDPLPDSYANLSWTFFLEEITPGSTRLITRWRSDFRVPKKQEIFYNETFTEPVGFVMEHKMLRGIKARAEKSN
jgi:hypothetical protein